MFGRILLRLKSIASDFLDFLLSTATARLIIVSRKLWNPVPILSVTVACAVIGCLALAGFAAQSVFTVLAPASPSGIGAGIAAMLAGLLVLELCAAAMLSLMEAMLQLADDIGRHRIHALLTIASTLAIATAATVLAAREGTAPSGTISAALTAAGLWVLTLWFQRAYRRPNHRGFRDFRVDVTDARHALLRGADGG